MVVTCSVPQWCFSNPLHLLGPNPAKRGHQTNAAHTQCGTRAQAALGATYNSWHVCTTASNADPLVKHQGRSTMQAPGCAVRLIRYIAAHIFCIIHALGMLFGRSGGTKSRPTHVQLREMHLGDKYQGVMGEHTYTPASPPRLHCLLTKRRAGTGNTDARQQFLCGAKHRCTTAQ